MKISRNSLLGLLGVATLLACLTQASAYDDLVPPPPDPVGTTYPKKTELSVQKAVETKLKTQFETVAGSSSTLTAKQAKDAGWGFVSDHFGQIDRDRDGFVTLGDVVNFMAARTPQKLMKAAKQSQQNKIQVVE
jgi:hypothetical protein